MRAARDPRHRLGRDGERRAEAYLVAAGCRILAKRYLWKGGEIDLIALEGDALLFVEVKTRASSLWGRPCEAVDTAKQHRLIRSARRFLAAYGDPEGPCRFDVVEVVIGPGEEPEIRWIRGAFDADGSSG